MVLGILTISHLLEKTSADDPITLLTSMTGVSRVVAVVAGDPQNPVLYVVHPVGCDFGAAVH